MGVMTESVETAMSLLRNRFVRTSEDLGTPMLNQKLLAQLLRSGPLVDSGGTEEDSDKDPFKGEDIHVHFPSGGIPKDGPSAGVAVLLALASLLLDKPVRSDTAVTGEVTLRGHVLPVGGIRDKVLAAHRAGISHVLLPFGNRRHVEDEIPHSAMRDIQIHYLKHIDEASSWAFAEDVKSCAVSAPSAQATAFAMSRL